MTAYSDFSCVPRKHYGFLLLDPAWKFKTYSPQTGKKGDRGAERHYPTMTLAEMKAMPVRDVAARDAWIGIWCTWPNLKIGLSLLEHYGFKYSSDLFVWFKMKKGFSPTREFITLPRDMHIGTGYTSRKNTEFVLLGRRGAPKVMAHDVHEPIFAPVREHSRKPDEQYPRIERFARGLTSK